MSTSSVSFNVWVRAAGSDVPAVYPLAIISPRQAGTAPSQIAGAPVFPSGHPMLRAHPSVPYRHRACAKGGAYPYVFTLSNAPAGMTVDPFTGLIEWPNPTGTSATPTLNVTDAEGTVRSETWTIQVTIAGFKFVSGTGSDAADGTLANPWRSLGRVRSSATPDDIIYFRAGTYSAQGLYTTDVIARSIDTSAFTPTTTSFEINDSTNLVGQTLIFATGANAGIGVLVTSGTVVDGRFRVTALHANVLVAAPANGDQFGVGNTWRRIEWSASAHSVKWLAYPGEQPILDNNFQSFLTDWGALHRLTGSATHPVYVRGFRHINILDKGFQLGANGGYHVFAELECGANSLATTVDGSNSGSIMCLTGNGSFAWFTHFCNLTNHDSHRGALKLYSQKHCVIENVDTINCDGSWDVKSHIVSFEIRRCLMRTMRSALQSGIHGNMAGADPDRTSGEVRFNLVDLRGVAGTDPLAADIGSDGNVGQIDVYRNTFIGRVLVRNIGSDDGPVRVRRNIIINTDAGDAERVHLSNNAAGRVEATDNLVGAPTDGIVDTDGRLQGAYRVPMYLGHYGQET